MSKVLELQKTKDLQKERTVAFASAAHEFRNPLNGIIQSLEVMGATNSVDMQRGAKSFHVAQSCASIMLCLANDILDFA
jgi:signal transduction histidine kinase